MKVIGLLGGMTCESSTEYYRLINQLTRKKLGGNHSARSVMVSVDFADVEPMMETGKWGQVLKILSKAVRDIENGGADFLVICTNTCHKFADQLTEKINIPILNIIDVTAKQIKSKRIKKVGLLGTRFTMEEEFYKKRLIEKHHLEIIIPGHDERQFIHRVIIDELSVGEINIGSKERYWEIINSLVQDGAEGIILGCTEIPLLVSEKDGNIPLFDTTSIHARAAVDYALNQTD